MTNTTRKGNATENFAKQILEQQGYLVHKTQRTMRRYGNNKFGSGDNDIFNCIDLIGKCHGKRTKWVQVKSSNKKKEVVEKCSKVPWDSQYDEVEYWLLKGKGKDKYFQVYRWEETWELIKDESHKEILREIKE